MGGLLFIADNFNVEEFWWNGLGDAEELLESLKKRVVTVFEFKEGGHGIERLKALNRSSNVLIEQLRPQTIREGSGLNNRSLVLRLLFNKVSFLFTGDIESEAESDILAAVPVSGIKSTVLKAPHHASSTSSTRAFVEAVSPEVVVVSVGKYNPFGFPHTDALKTYKEIGAKIYRTDLDGAVEVISDGLGYSVSTYAP